MVINIIMITTSDKTKQPKLNHNGIGDECNYHEALEFLYTLREEFK